MKLTNYETRLNIFYQTYNRQNLTYKMKFIKSLKFINKINLFLSELLKIKCSMKCKLFFYY